MSGTDKDKPWWTRGTWDAHHHRVGPHGCDLPAGPPKRMLSSPRRRVETLCTWWPTSDVHPIGMPPKWYRDHVWTNRQRVATRDDCRRAAAEYRTHGEVETVPSVDQHRHCATWLWT